MTNEDAARSVLSSREAARELGYSESYLRGLLRSGAIRGGRMLSEWIIFREDLELYKLRMPKRGRPRKKRIYTKTSSYWDKYQKS